jgi:hypothetical protein
MGEEDGMGGGNDAAWRFAARGRQRQCQIMQFTTIMERTEAEQRAAPRCTSVARCTPTSAASTAGQPRRYPALVSRQESTSAWATPQPAESETVSRRHVTVRMEVEGCSR